MRNMVGNIIMQKKRPEIHNDNVAADVSPEQVRFPISIPFRVWQVLVNECKILTSVKLQQVFVSPTSITAMCLKRLVAKYRLPLFRRFQIQFSLVIYIDLASGVVFGRPFLTGLLTMFRHAFLEAQT